MLVIARLGRRRTPDEGGAVLVTVIVVMLVGFVIATVIAASVLFTIQSNVGNKDRTQAFIAAERFDESGLHELLTAHGLSYTLQQIPERNWNAEWEAAFQPVVVEGFCAIRAHFHPPMPGVEH